MAGAFAQAVEAGHAARAAGPIEARDLAHALDAGDRHGLPRMSLPRVYPIVDSADWVQRLAPLGVRLVQLRIKDAARSLRSPRRSARAQACCRRRGMQLIVNDYWRLALAAGCDFVHLGQGDLEGADLAALRRAGVRLGVSTHDEAELERALGAGAGLRGARAHLPHDAQGDALGAAGPGAHRAVEAPHRRAAAGRHRRRDARAPAARCSPPARTSRRWCSDIVRRRTIRRRARGNGSTSRRPEGPRYERSLRAPDRCCRRSGLRARRGSRGATVLVVGRRRTGLRAAALPGRGRRRAPDHFRSRPRGGVEPAPPAAVSHGPIWADSRSQAARDALLAAESAGARRRAHP